MHASFLRYYLLPFCSKPLRPCSHHSFGTGTVAERNRAPICTPVPLRPVIPERADHLAMWSQWNGSGTGPVGSVVWTRDWTRSGTVPVARDIRRFPTHISKRSSLHGILPQIVWLATSPDTRIDRSASHDQICKKMPDCPNFGRSGHPKSSCANYVVCSSPILFYFILFYFILFYFQL